MKENILPFNGCLSVFINYIDPICIVCRNNIETGEHAFMQCSFARAVWAQCYLNLDNATYGSVTLLTGALVGLEMTYLTLPLAPGKIFVLPSAGTSGNPDVKQFFRK